MSIKGNNRVYYLVFSFKMVQINSNLYVKLQLQCDIFVGKKRGHTTFNEEAGQTWMQQLQRGIQTESPNPLKTLKSTELVTLRLYILCLSLGEKYCKNIIYYSLRTSPLDEFFTQWLFFNIRMFLPKLLAVGPI